MKKSMTKAKCTQACQAMNMPVAILQTYNMFTMDMDILQASLVLYNVKVY